MNKRHDAAAQVVTKLHIQPNQQGVFIIAILVNQFSTCMKKNPWSKSLCIYLDSKEPIMILLHS